MGKQKAKKRSSIYSAPHPDLNEGPSADGFAETRVGINSNTPQGIIHGREAGGSKEQQINQIHD